jgi:hypothetical protein
MHGMANLLKPITLGVSQILQGLNLDEASLLAANNIARTLNKEALVKLIGEESAKLLIGYRGLRQAQAKLVREDGGLSVSGQEEMLRKMLLAFGDDLRSSADLSSLSIANIALDYPGKDFSASAMGARDLRYRCVISQSLRYLANEMGDGGSRVQSAFSADVS